VQWPKIKIQLDAMQADETYRQGVSRTISYLKRKTCDTPHKLNFPAPNDSLNRPLAGPVVPRTLFGDEADSSPNDRRRSFADWLVSARNPRFARNIANRLWKRVIGLGLVEPVDSLSPITRAEHAEVWAFLTEAIIRLRFDERAFLSMLLNTRLYQSESVSEGPAPAAACDLRGPIQRRLSAEQLWDSLLVQLVADVDERKSLLRHDHSELDPERLRQLSNMSAEEILERTKVELEQRKKQRRHVQRLAEQAAQMEVAKPAGDAVAVRSLRAEHIRKNTERELERQSARMGSAYFARENDPRWRSLPQDLVRASEIPTPVPLGHFLRQFGQSDRREIDAFNREPNTTHSLALMNGQLTGLVLKDTSLLRTRLREFRERELKVRAIYQAILARYPSPEEIGRVLNVSGDSPALEEDLIWALSNTPEFLFLK
jgi:hypothetical protein